MHDTLVSSKGIPMYNELFWLFSGTLWSMLIRRCGHFFAAGKEKSFGIRLGELALVKNANAGHL